MVKYFSIFICLLFAKGAFSQSKGITLLDHWQNPNLPRLNGYQIWSDLTGYVDTATGKEYIIAGSTDSIYFFDISDPTNIKLVDVEDGRSKQMVNRDFECYSHYVYCVSDNRNLGSLQIFDLSYLPDSVHKVYDSDSIAFNTHSIFIEAKSKRLYMCINRNKTGINAAMDIVSLENPEVPVKIGSLVVPQFDGGTKAFNNVHEVFVKNDTAWCSTEYSGLWIFDLTNLSRQRLLGVIANYPENGYNHSSWLSPNGQYCMFTDEVPGGLSIKIFDVSVLADPKLVSRFESTELATAHNAFWVGSFAYVSYYHDGVVIFDLSNPFSPKEVGHYRTFPWPPQSYEGYNGCWGIYPWFPSGTLAASDMQEGIFTLKPDKELTGIKSQSIEEFAFNYFPNPTTKALQVSFTADKKLDKTLSILSLEGKTLLQKQGKQLTFEFDLEALPEGIYLLTIETPGHNKAVRRIIKY